VLVTNAKNFIKSMSLRSNFFQRLVGNGLLTSQAKNETPAPSVATGVSPGAGGIVRPGYGRLHDASDTKWNEGENATFTAT